MFVVELLLLKKKQVFFRNKFISNRGVYVLPDDIINDNPSADALLTTERERCFMLVGGEPLDPFAVSDDEAISKLKQKQHSLVFCYRS